MLKFTEWRFYFFNYCLALLSLNSFHVTGFLSWGGGRERNQWHDMG